MAGTLGVDLVGAFRLLGKDADAIGQNLHRPAIDGQVLFPATRHGVCQDSGADFSQKRRVSGQHAGIASGEGQLDRDGILLHHEPVRDCDLEANGVLRHGNRLGAERDLPSRGRLAASAGISRGATVGNF